MIRIVLFIQFLICDPKLISVQSISRHGDRGPEEHIPGFIELIPGELTERGMYEHFQIGSQMREHYKGNSGFLSETYNSHELYVRSSNFDRCLMSAWSQLAGLYPNGLSDKHIQGFPVQTELKQEEFHYRAFEECPIARTYDDEFRKTDEYKKFISDQKQLWADLSRKISHEVTESNWLNVDDALVVQRTHTEVDAETIELHDRLRKSVFQRRLQLFPGEDEKWLKASIGLLFGDMFFQNIDADLTGLLPSNAPNPHDASRKFRLNLAHDNTIWAVLRSLKYPMTSHPFYACTILVELWIHEDVLKTATTKAELEKSAYLRFYFQDEQDKHNAGELWKEMPLIRGCKDQACDLTTFRQEWAPFVIADSNLIQTEYREKRCNNTNFYPPLPKKSPSALGTEKARQAMLIATIAFALLSVVGIIVVIVLSVLISRKKKSLGFFQVPQGRSTNYTE
ncbi:putative Lysosomal acid phosphatase [Blattamonas nauphoetae]|uniref:Lysosomal acid phosphatase n=1 Tax=Blattamonas nauphoetae TaxID=2049346 RepID=A0ABQ9X456_9EUKA|nr:putative Lysosomal acid phosphatase [Blattamonas nauphoetae]